MKAPRFAARARLAALLAILALEACSRGHADSAAQPVRGGDGDLVAYRGRFEPRFLLTGQLEAIAAENLIVPRIPNWQTTIRWLESEGAVVRKGQRLVEFDTTSFAQDFGEKLLAWEQAGSGLAKAEADRVAASADTEFQVAQRSIAVRKAEIAAAIPVEFLRGKDFQENQIALTRARTELAKAEEDRASRDVASEEAVHQARIVLDKARRELDAARQAMDGMVLKAPRDGIVVIGEHPWEGRKFQVGDTVWVGLTVARLPDLSMMRVGAKLWDVDDGRIAPALQATCVLDAFPDREFAGRVAEITPVAQEDPGGRSLRRSYNVRVDLDACDAERMRPGMSVKVEVRGAPLEGVLLAPRAGLDLGGKAPRARLASGRLVDVKLGPCGDAECVVEGGIAAGDRLRAGS